MTCPEADVAAELRDFYLCVLRAMQVPSAFGFDWTRQAVTRLALSITGMSAKFI
jgi:hypothetical protein